MLIFGSKNIMSIPYTDKFYMKYFQEFKCHGLKKMFFFFCSMVVKTMDFGALVLGFDPLRSYRLYPWTNYTTHMPLFRPRIQMGMNSKRTTGWQLFLRVEILRHKICNKTLIQSVIYIFTNLLKILFQLLILVCEMFKNQSS